MMSDHSAVVLGDVELVQKTGSEHHNVIHSIGDIPPIHSSSSSSSTVQKTMCEEKETLNAEIAATGSRTNVNLLFWLRTYRMMKIATGSPRVSPMLWFLMLLNITLQFLGAYMIQAQLHYTSTGSSKDSPGLAGCLKSGVCSNSTYECYLNRWAWQFAIIIICLCGFAVSGDYINTLMRKRINTYMHTRLLQGHLSYRIQLARQIDNFDQRMTSDTQAMLDGIICTIFGNTSDYLAYPVFFCIGRFSWGLNNLLRPPNQLDLDTGRSFQVFMVAFALCLVAVVVYILPMNYISRLFFLGQKFEGIFRAQHAKCGLNAEQICLYSGEQLEGRKATKAYDQVFRLHMKYYYWQGGLMFLRLISTVAQPSISYMMLTLANAKDVSYSSAFLKQSGDVLQYMLLLPAIMARLAFIAGATHRVGELLEGMEYMEQYVKVQEIAQRQQQLRLAIHVEQHVGKPIDFIELKNIVASPPQPPPLVALNLSCTSNPRDFDTTMSQDDSMKEVKQALFNDISFRVNRGDSLVIMGESGCGKSSLLRVIAGLWPVTSGQVIRPKNIGRDGLFFLPQKAYLFPGTLMEQITYPSPGHEGNIQLEEITGLLHKLDLYHLVEQYNWDSSIDWSSVLSSSERQRLSFARLFFHRPLFCLADEATSCLDIENETIALDLCKKLNITLISVAHRPSVIGHHKNILQFDKNSRAWDLVEVTDEHRVIDGHAADHATSISPALPPRPKKMKKQKATPTSQGVNLLFLRRLLRAFRLICNGWTSSGAYLVFSMFFCMAVYGVILVLQTMYLTTDSIVNNIINGNTQTALNTAGIHLVVNIAGSITQAASATCGAIFGCLMQRQMIRQIHANYYSKNVLYSMNSGSSQLDGIDGRIVSDANQMREAVSWLFGSPFSYLNYRLGFFPGFIVLLTMVCYAFSLAWGLTLFFLGNLFGALLCQTAASIVLSPAMNRRQGAEGRLYAHYARIRSSIESITFFEGVDAELARAEVLLEDVYETRLAYAWRACFTTLPTVIMFFWLTSGNYVMASIIQVWSSSSIDPSVMLNLIAFCDKTGRFGFSIVQSMGGFGMLSAYTHRIAEVQEIAAEQAFLNQQIIEKQIHDQNMVALIDTIIMAGMNESNVNAHILVNDLRFNVTPGASILVMGASSCGKSMIHRVLARLIDCNTERLRDACVTRPQHTGHDGIYFIPQSNYTTDGSLAEQIIYPHRLDQSMMNNAELEAILTEVGLSYLVGRWTLNATGIEWSELLSGGESQRLGIARVLYHRPRFACLDESTSALDLALEADCMNAIRKRGITMISVATRMTQKRYHQKLLYLDGNGGWTLTNITNTRQSLIVPEYRAPNPAAVINHVVLTRRDSVPAEWVDADDPDINEIVVTSRSKRLTRKTISMSISKW